MSSFNPAACAIVWIWPCSPTNAFTAALEFTTTFFCVGLGAPAAAQMTFTDVTVARGLGIELTPLGSHDQATGLQTKGDLSDQLRRQEDQEVQARPSVSGHLQLRWLVFD